jgi:hypothetical protein
MKKKSVFIRAIKFSLICGSLILLMAVYKMITTNLVGTTIEIFIRFIITVVGVYSPMYLVFVLYLHFNPDADEPRNKSK